MDLFIDYYVYDDANGNTSCCYVTREEAEKDLKNNESFKWTKEAEVKEYKEKFLQTGEDK